MIKKYSEFIVLLRKIYFFNVLFKLIENRSRIILDIKKAINFYLIPCKIRFKNEPKVFCIGSNKTGTTTLKVALTGLNYVIGDQEKAELLLEDYKKRSFYRLIKYCQKAEAFQDIPFSLPYTYILLDHMFPGSKFILSIRKNEHEWYDSYIRYQKQGLGTSTLPTVHELKNHDYVYKGWLYDVKSAREPIDDSMIYDEKYCKNNYLSHIKDVIRYFAYRPNDLLVLNVADKDAYIKLCKFLKKTPRADKMPWENRSK